MGISKYDKSAQHKRLETTYGALNSASKVRLLLEDYHALCIRTEAGDFAAVDILADLARAIEMAELTRRQREVLYYVYVRDLTQSAAAKRMGIAQKNVNTLLDRAEEAIADVYYYWAGHREGYAV